MNLTPLDQKIMTATRKTKRGTHNSAGCCHMHGQLTTYTNLSSNSIVATFDTISRNTDTNIHHNDEETMTWKRKGKSTYCRRKYHEMHICRW
jgi:hypothetical protein